MRLITAALVLSLLTWGSAVQANTLVFGSLTDNSSCSLSGNGADRSCTNTASVSNGALDATASANFRGQASADHGLTTNSTAIADITVSYNVPFTITRDLTWTQIGDGTWDISVPLQTITLSTNYSGEASKDNSQTAGGLGQATAFTATVSGFGISTSNAGGAQTGGGGLNRSQFNNNDSDGSTQFSLNQSGAALGEISLVAQLPTDYRAWTDNLVTFVNPDEGGPSTLQQTFSGSINVSFRLRAESRPSGSISTTGGEALACAGQTSPLGGFDLDGGANCGSGLNITGVVAQTATSVFNVIPEPQTALLVGLGLAGLAALRQRRQG